MGKRHCFIGSKWHWLDLFFYFFSIIGWLWLGDEPAAHVDETRSLATCPIHAGFKG